MGLVSRTCYFVIEMTFKAWELRTTASRVWTWLSPVEQEGSRSGNEWRMWLLFWVVFLVGCTLTAAVASSWNRSPEVLIIR